MAKIRLEIELDYDSDLMHVDQAWHRWFREKVLGGTGYEGLVLHSNYIGDEVGTVKVLRLIEPWK